jgi:DNA polymerase-3 subunit delta
MVLAGENSFEIERALAVIIKGFDGTAEKIDGTEIETKQLPDILMGATLFAQTRLVVLKNLSQNKAVWASFADWIPRVSDDIQVVLVEQKLDKRTKTYKTLQKSGTIKEFALWGDRDTGVAEKWVIGEAKTMGFALDSRLARTLVMRVGLGQWALYQALQKLSVVDSVDEEAIRTLIDANPVENVFNLFETALRGDSEGVARMIATLATTDDAYKLFGLLGGQVIQLAALTVADKPAAEIAKDMGVHPYALSKMSPYAKKVGRHGAHQAINVFAEADTAMKSSSADPWLLIERALMKVAQL